MVARIRAIALLIAITSLTAAAAASPAEAQFDPFGWIQQLFQPPPGHVATPKSETRRAAREPRIPRTRSSHAGLHKSEDKFTEDKFTKARPKPGVAPTYFVAVLGDSLAQQLAQGLTEAFDNRPEVAILRKAKEDSGLVRDDFYDWTKAAADLLASGEKIDFAVMLIGSNDRQVLRDANGTFEPRTPEWQAAYTNRIETIAALFRDKKIPLLWVGLPIMKSEGLAADAMAFNEFYRAYAEKAGATYLDIWEIFADESGQYTPVGPDIIGQTVRLRAADGIHFTKAGARKLAHFVEPAIRRNLDEVQPNAVTAAPQEAVPEASNAAEPPAGEDKPKPKPVAGPVQSLTGPPTSPGGELATRTAAQGTKNNAADTLIVQTLQQGKPLASKHGRADDFSWPRH